VISFRKNLFKGTQARLNVRVNSNKNKEKLACVNRQIGFQGGVAIIFVGVKRSRGRGGSSILSLSRWPDSKYLESQEVRVSGAGNVVIGGKESATAYEMRRTGQAADLY